MKALDIVKPVCKGFVLGAVLVVMTKPFKLHVRVGKQSLEFTKS